MFESMEFVIEGKKLQVLATGAGTPIMLLHGGGADSALVSWGGVAETLSKRFRVYMPNWPGYGNSEAREGVLRSEDLPTIIEELRIQLGIDRMRLVGISLGGIASMGYLLRHPSTTEAVVAFGCGGLQDWSVYHGMAWLLVKIPVIGRAMGTAQWKSLIKNEKLLRSSIKPLLPTFDSIPDELVKVVADELRGRKDHSVFFRWQRDEIRLSGLKTNFTPMLHSISKPVLLVHGTKDVAAPVKYARRAAGLIPGARYEEIEGAGHWIPREFPERTTELITEFLGS